MEKKDGMRAPEDYVGRRVYKDFLFQLKGEALEKLLVETRTGAYENLLRLGFF